MALALEYIRDREEMRGKYKGAAKYRMITVTDVQSDGRPRAVPRDSHGALPVCDAVVAARLYRRRSSTATVDRQQPHLGAGAEEACQVAARECSA
eukprot:scaffold812_cov126-Isochrysis_galbana.AAC.7